MANSMLRMAICKIDTRSVITRGSTMKYREAHCPERDLPWRQRQPRGRSLLPAHQAGGTEDHDQDEHDKEDDRRPIEADDEDGDRLDKADHVAPTMVPGRLPSPPKTTTIKARKRGSLPITGVMKKSPPSMTPARAASAALTAKMSG